MHTHLAAQPQAAGSTSRWASVQAGMEEVEAYAHVLGEADVVLFNYVLTEFAPPDAGEASKQAYVKSVTVLTPCLPVPVVPTVCGQAD